jgi:Flp pilus assembly protein CpaB
MHGSDSVPSTTADSSTRKLRSGGPRRGLPTGRALVGGLLVTVAAVLVFAAYAGATDRPERSVVVARRDVDPGERLEAADLDVRSVDLPADLAGRAFDSADELVGAIALGPIATGELVQEGTVRLGDPEATGPEFSFPVERERALAGDVRAGERIDLLATFGSGSDASTVVLARDARVRHVQESRSGTLGSSGQLVVTVGLASGDEVLDVAHASQVATITVVRSGHTAGASTASSADAATDSAGTGGAS